MVKLELLGALVVLVLLVFCLVEIIQTPDGSTRNLPKTAWLLLVLFFPFVGSVAWLVAGRPRVARPLPREQGGAPQFPEYERPGRMAAQDPQKDQEFLRQVRERAEEQRRRYEAEKRRREAEGGGGSTDPT